MRRLRAETDDLDVRATIDGIVAIRRLIQEANGHADKDGSSRDMVIANMGMLHQRLRRETRTFSRVLELQLVVRRHQLDVYEAGELHAAPVTTNMGATQAMNTERFIRPSWSPAVCVGIDNRTAIVIELIDTHREGMGFGTMAITAVMQALADNQKHLARLEAHECYFPTYYVTDAMYGWTVRLSPRRAKTTSKEVMHAAPRLIYPRWLHIVPGDREATADRDIENMEAIYQPVDLCWASPALWHENRCRAAAQLNDPSAETDGINLRFDLLEHLRTWRNRFGALAVEREQPQRATEWPDAVIRGLVAWQAPLHRIGELSEYNVDQPLVTMGNTDVPGPLCMLLYPLRGELPALKDWDAQTRLVFRLVVAYLVDYGRVMWRPLVIDGPLARLVMEAAGVESLTDLFDMTPQADDPDRLMPPLAPYFHSTRSTGGDSYVWIPTKKPRETSSRAGTDRIPLPRRERPTRLALRAPEPMEEEKDEETGERPSKKPRFQCHFCARYEPAFADAVHFFCDATCQSNYYA